MVPDPPELDRAGLQIAEWFYQISEKRQSGVNGPLPIPYSEIESWMRTTRKLIRPDEVEAIAAMDSAHLKAVQKHQQEQRDKDKGKSK